MYWWVGPEHCGNSKHARDNDRAQKHYNIILPFKSPGIVQETPTYREIKQDFPGCSCMQVEGFCNFIVMTKET